MLKIGRFTQTERTSSCLFHTWHITTRSLQVMQIQTSYPSQSASKQLTAKFGRHRDLMKVCEKNKIFLH